ncbi:MAG: cytochrome c [Deinococcales bacterium]
MLGLTLAQSPYGFGVPVDEEMVMSFNIHPSIAPDGRGLPEGEGSALEGFEVYAFICAGCHGPNAEGGPYDRLVSDRDFSAEVPDHLLAVGNYWPYATTLYDYIRRAMPFSQPGSLEPNDIYALVAFILAENGIIEEDFYLNAETLPQVEMPAKVIFNPSPDSFLPRTEE